MKEEACAVHGNVLILRKAYHMELTTVQYRRHRLAYSVSAVIGFLAAWQGYYWLASGSVSSFFGWVFLIIGLIACCGCTWTAIRKSLVLELNQEGVWYKEDTYDWHSLRSYAIRKEVAEGGLFVYLILFFMDGREPLEIQLDWLENNEAIPEQMEAYAKKFQVRFDGVERKEI
ncbi:hypothetical protein HHL17_20495 [Chitinophaga sp. G-6-1-13]|uniref:Uncharacterized protein n=1 Tax=Chitinophaga fulva TaxID=2728842 RepID=A0A848GPW4_9BACT|nr:hypothetical protein [Chitinophaga fulva]NML39591.1 hypothetical protein [Chitinophaga fulva]